MRCDGRNSGEGCADYRREQGQTGGEGAQMEIVDGAKTSVQLATLPENGPTGGYFHMGEALPW
jgi:hypothetical protein